MAKLVPSLGHINNFTPLLEEGARSLLNALRSILDDEWMIDVQPFLNGLQPDMIIFSEQAGLAIFEVKDWNLNRCCTHARYRIDRPLSQILPSASSSKSKLSDAGRGVFGLLKSMMICVLICAGRN